MWWLLKAGTLFVSESAGWFLPFRFFLGVEKSSAWAEGGPGGAGMEFNRS